MLSSILNMLNKNIYLTGMMGSGKSTIGTLLSKQINIPLIDMDIELEKIMGMSIDSIFNEYGENRFRMIETSFFNEITKNKVFIYATGGGIVLDKKNQKILAENGITIFLDCSLNVLQDRLKNNLDFRPLLKDNFKKQITDIYRERYDLYKSCANFIQDTSTLTPDETINRIRKYLNV